ncbi:MAG: zinc ribbon domain-containing protein, partial [Anaerolineae bacterium]|nr:zinc ribbon domain-containing protein [Anaerolineae bacterium]
RVQQLIATRRSQGGLAKPVNRALLSGLIVCRHCGWNFRQKHVNYTRGGKRTRYRYYTDGGYNAGGRAMCMLTNIPADALDAWVLQKVRDVVLGDHATVAKAVDAFVRAVLDQRAQRPDAGDAQRDLDLLNRRIKTTVGLLADPAFDGLDELRTTLADLKAKRDAVRKRIAEAAAPTGTPVSEKALRAWAADQFRQLADACARRSSALDTRQLVHAYVERIEIDPHAKRGVLYLPADAYALYARSVSTRGALGDPLGRVKAVAILTAPQDAQSAEDPGEPGQFKPIANAAEHPLEIIGKIATGRITLPLEAAGDRAYVFQPRLTYDDGHVRHYSATELGHNPKAGPTERYKPTEGFGGPAEPLAKEVEVKLPEDVEAIQVAGAGRYLCLKLRDLPAISVLDTFEARLVKHIRMPSTEFMFAAGGNVVLVYLPDDHIFRTYARHGR